MFSSYRQDSFLPAQVRKLCDTAYHHFWQRPFVELTSHDARGAIERTPASRITWQIPKGLLLVEETAVG